MTLKHILTIYQGWKYHNGQIVTDEKLLKQLQDDGVMFTKQGWYDLKKRILAGKKVRKATIDKVLNNFKNQ